MKKLLLALALLSATILSSQTPALAQDSKPTFELLTPKADQTIYGNKVPLLFNVEGLTLTNSEIQKVGEGRVLVWLDQPSPSRENATRVYENTFIFSDVAYGNHTLTAELVTNDEKSFTPPKTVSVNFKSEILASDEQATISNGFDKTTAVVILTVVALVILAAWWYTKDEEDTPITETTKKISKKTKKTTKVKSRKKIKK